MENEQTLKIPEFHFCTNLSRRPLKIPESEYYTLKIRRALPITLPWKCPPPPLRGPKLTIHMQKLCFLYHLKAVPLKEKYSLGREKKMESSTLEKTALIHQTKEILTSKPTFTQGVSEKLLINGEHKSPPEHTFIWCLA